MLVVGALVGALASACGQADTTAGSAQAPPASSTATPATAAASTAASTVGASAVTARPGPTVVVAAGQAGLWPFAVVADPPRDRVYAVWGTASQTGDELEVWVAASRDGGRSFGAPVRAASDAQANQPTLRVDGAGTVFVSYTHFDTDPGHRMTKDQYSNPGWIRIVRSADGGRTFSAPVDTVANTRRSAVAFGTLAVAPAGDVMTAFWLDYLPSYIPTLPQVGRDAARLVAATSTDGGRTFGAPRTVARTACVCCEPFGFELAGATNAVLFRGWKPATAKADQRDIQLSSLAAGGSWTAPVPVHDDRFLLHHCPSVGPAAASASDGTTHVVWWTGATGRAGYWYATTRDGRTFTDPIEVEPHPSAPNENNATIALDGRGRVWTATVEHGMYADDGSEDASRNAVAVFVIEGGRAARVPALAAPGAFPQLAPTRDGALVELWVDHGRVLARRVEVS